MDSDGDGIGDLAGIKSRLDHVSGIAGIVWVSPFYPSPQQDFGYDITNFTGVDPMYGTLGDFDEVVRKAKSLGLKIVLDFVPNHTSDQHEWFKKSVKRIAPYADYYVWADARIAANGTRLPPNNWLSSFFGSIWEWNEERGQYYLHHFIASQPDLNYHSPLVQEEMKNVLTFWLNRGIDGFRVDAIAHLVEDDQFRDEPRSKNNVSPDDYRYHKHVYIRDLQKTYDIVESWKKLADEYSTEHETREILFLMELSSDFPYMMKYYDIGTVPFNFKFLKELNNGSTVEDFQRNITTWMDLMPEGAVANWIVSNHDHSRVATKFGYRRADQMLMLCSILPGITIIHNGDEIGMVDKFFTYEETKDPFACNAGPERYQLKTRDPERTPYQWDNTVSAGFSTNPNTWLPVNENYVTLNLALQKTAEVSHYKVFQALAKIKKSPILVNGAYKVSNITDKVLAVFRIFQGQYVILLINFDDDNSVEVNIRELANVPEEMSVYVASIQSGLKNKQVFNTTRLLIPGSASIVLI